jgi:hypothetical protein
MAGILLRLQTRSKDHVLRLANNTLLELSKRAINSSIHDPYSALGVFSHPNAPSAVISHLVTMRQFSSSGRSLYSTISPLKTPRETCETRQIVKKSNTTVSRLKFEVLPPNLYFYTEPPPRRRCCCCHL